MPTPRSAALGRVMGVSPSISRPSGLDELRTRCFPRDERCEAEELNAGVYCRANCGIHPPGARTLRPRRRHRTRAEAERAEAEWFLSCADVTK